MLRPDAHARRATVEDLPQLLALWKLEQLPTNDLEKRFTEFQVVVDDAGTVLATVGLQVSGTAGKLHSEAIKVPADADDLRELLWKRVEVVCRNHSVDRIWTQMTVPFVRTRGFAPASTEQIAMVPEDFGERSPGWQLLRLRSGDASSDAIEKQFAMLKTLHHAETERLQRQARTLKAVAIVLVVIVSVIVVAWLVVVLKYGPRFLQRH